MRVVLRSDITIFHKVVIHSLSLKTHMEYTHNGVLCVFLYLVNTVQQKQKKLTKQKDSSTLADHTDDDMDRKVAWKQL